MVNESVPDDWKVANVVPVYKGGSRNVATNYRQISLTSQLCKVFETVVRDKQLIEQVQRRFTKMIKNMKRKSYEEILDCLRLWSLEVRRNRQDLIEVFKMCKGPDTRPVKTGRPDGPS